MGEQLKTMVHVYRVTLALALYIGLIYGCRSNRETAGSVFHGPVAQPSTHAELFPAHGWSPQERQAFQRDLAARTERLGRMEAERTKRDRALSQRPARVTRVQLAVRLPWAQLVSTNYARFEELKRAAAQDPAGEVACDICDGASYMPCLLCDTAAQCADCLGMGEPVHGQFCPLCVGSGKCTMCNGFGKMLCPFCDDGTITADHPEPRESCWVE